MPIVNGQRVLSSDPRYTSTLNARGGINKSNTVTSPNGLANSATPAVVAPPSVQTSPTPFKINTPDTVNPITLQNAPGRTEVFAARDQMQMQADQTNQLATDYNNLNSRIGNITPASPFVNPENFLNGLFLRGNTYTQNALDTQGQTQADTIRGFASDYTQAGKDARTQFAIPELQTNLADTRSRIAERQVKLRETLRDFETNAERRGVAREFVDSEKAKVQADAATELADLAIIENAQLGNLNEARAEVDNILAEKKQAFEFENAAIEAEITRLEKMDTRESQARSEQLQIALQERTRNIETALANEKEIRGYIIEAASKGADQGTLAAIRNAKTPAEAVFLATPFMAPQAKAVGAPEIKNFGTTDAPMWKQFNASTGSWEDVSGITDMSSATAPDEAQKALDQISFLKTTITDSEGLVDATGPNMISQGLGNFFVGNTRVKQLANKLDTLKTNLLTLNSDPALKKFFGPQMTEKDTQLLMSAGSTLNAYSANEADNKAELKRYSDLLNRMETAIKQGQKAVQPPVTQTGPDGVVYQFID